VLYCIVIFFQAIVFTGVIYFVGFHTDGVFTIASSHLISLRYTAKSFIHELINMLAFQMLIKFEVQSMSSRIYASLMHRLGQNFNRLGIELGTPDI